MHFKTRHGNLGGRVYEAVIRRGGKFLWGIGWVVEDSASDIATNTDFREYIHLLCD